MEINCRVCGIRYRSNGLWNRRSICVLCYSLKMFERFENVTEEIRTTWNATVGTPNHRRAMNVLYCRRYRVMRWLDRNYGVTKNV